MVSVEEIKVPIAEREEEMKKKFREEEIVKRENLNTVKKQVTKDLVNIITGVRRCGKSVFAFQLFTDENFGYVNFEDERLSIKAEELNKVLEAVYSLKGEVNTVIFDEIQNINGWEKFITRLVGTKKIIITGSNARLMSKELATLLTGRHIDFALFPFSFREFLEYKNVKLERKDFYLTIKIAKIKNLLGDFLNQGGFPLALKVGKIFLVENYRDIVERDIIQRYKIKMEPKLKELSKYLISNYANEITYNTLKSIVSVKSTNTISDWIEKIENSFLIFKLERFSYKLKESILAPKKVYSIDTGLSLAVGHKISENFGKLMENLVATEFLRKKGYEQERYEIFYWKDYQQNEVDFVLKEGLKVKQLVQVTYASSKDEIERREIKSLVKASELLKCKDLLVITWDLEDEMKVENKKIVFKPLWKWLLS